MDCHSLEHNSRQLPPTNAEIIVKMMRLETVSQMDLIPRAARPDTTLAWGRKFLPAYFVQQPSLMHEWLGAELDSSHAVRGSKINLVGPRGSAKSTIATLCHVLRSALERWEPYIWIVSDTKE